MSKTDKQIVDRVEKLLRLAAPSMNTSESERSSAALAAASLIAEHGLVVVSKDTIAQAATQTSSPSAPPRRKKRREHPGYGPPSTSTAWGRVVSTPSGPTWQTAQPGPPPGWTRSIAARPSCCADPDCEGEIDRGEPVWMRIRGFEVEYLHIDGPCGW